MQTNFEKTAANERKITFTYTAEELEAAAQQAYLTERKRIALPGFRKGHAPRALIERYYGADLFVNDGIEERAQKDWTAYVDEHPEVKVVDRPQMEIVKADKAEGAEVAITVTVSPEVKLGSYKGLTTTVTRHEISEEAVQSRIDAELKKQTARTKIEDRPAKNGDSVNIDYAGTVDGVAFEGGTAKAYELVLGSNSFIPGFESQVEGMSIGEEKDINVTFPEEYHAEDLKGKAAVFHVKVNGITELSVPELDDDFVQDISEFDTVEEYRNDIRKNMEKQQRENEDAQVKNTLLDIVSDEAEMDIPNAMIERQISANVDNIRRQFAQYGMKLEDYLESTKTSMEAFRLTQKEDAEKNIRRALTLEAVAEAEGLKATDEEVAERIKKYGEDYGEAYAKMLEGSKDAVRNELEDEKVLNFLYENAQIDEVTGDEEEEPKAEETKPETEEEA